jgi:hypothetical protein
MDRPNLVIHVQVEWMNTDDMQGLAIKAARNAVICTACDHLQDQMVSMLGYKVAIIDWKQPSGIVPANRIAYGKSLISARVAEFDAREGWRYD